MENFAQQSQNQYNIDSNNLLEQQNELIISLEKLILQCNQVAIDHLKNSQNNNKIKQLMVIIQKIQNIDNFNESIQFLKKSEQLLLKEYKDNKENLIINKLLGITYNNMGCHYRKQNSLLQLIALFRDNKPKVALKYLKRALDIEIYSISDCATIAGTHLNICAINSCLQRHDIAIEHAKLAINLLNTAKQQIQDYLVCPGLQMPLINEELCESEQSCSLQSLDLQQYYCENIPQIETNEDFYQKKLTFYPKQINKLRNIITTLIISQYNLGVEYEFEKQNEESLMSYQKGYEIALQYLGPSQSLTKQLKEIRDKLQYKVIFEQKKMFLKDETKLKVQEKGYHSYIRHYKKSEKLTWKEIVERAHKYPYLQLQDFKKKPQKSLQIQKCQNINNTSADFLPEVKQRSISPNYLTKNDPNLNLNDKYQTYQYQTPIQNRSIRSKTLQRLRGFKNQETNNNNIQTHTLSSQEDYLVNDDNSYKKLIRTQPFSLKRNNKPLSTLPIEDNY